MIKKKIRIDIVIYAEKDREEKVYSITALQIPNVVTQGKTRKEAIENLKEALELYFEEMPEERKRMVQIVKEESRPVVQRILV